jgi:hypothetical protein
MYVPGLLERVHLAGSDEVYLVVAMNEAKDAADLLPVRFGGERRRAVPVMHLEAIDPDTAWQLLRRPPHEL